MKIDAVMSPTPFIVDAKTTLADAQKEMKTHGIRHLLVSEEGTLVGVLTEGNVKSALSFREKGDRLPTVGDICNPEFVVVPRGSSLADVARQMGAQKLSCVVVIDDEERASGIFTTTDACRVLSLLLEKVETKK